MTEMQSPKVSIITPVYMAEPYLPLFLDSVLRQSFQDWELLLIDDGSPDRCGEICDHAAADDSRIKVYHQDNQGVSGARNRGLAAASGEWIFFADPDDELTPDCLAVLLSGVDDTIDLVCASYFRIVGEKEEPETIFKEAGVLPRIPYMEEISNLPNARWLERYLTTKLFRAAIIKQHNIRFNNRLHYREDIAFLYAYLLKCNGDIRGIDVPVYRYNRRPTGMAMKSVTQLTNGSFDAIFSVAECLKGMKHHKEYDQAAHYLHQDMLAWYKYLHKLRSRGIKKGLIGPDDFKDKFKEMNKAFRRSMPLPQYLLFIGKRKFLSFYYRFKKLFQANDNRI